MENKTTSFKAAFAFSKGMVRENNEDNFVVNLNLTGDNWTCQNDEEKLDLGNKGAMFVVADGMGGLNAGEEASRISVETIEQFFNQMRDLPFNESEIPQLLREVILQSNKKIVEFAEVNPNSRGLGTTLTIVWLYGNVIYIGWVGDSRVYGLRQNGEFSQLNKDHSLVQELVDAGKLDPDQAFYHPDKNIITRSLGDSGVYPQPQCTPPIPVTSGDRILVCSDGLNTMLQDSEIRERLSGIQGTKDCADQLVLAANAAGGHDNITVILCDIVSANGIITPLNQPLSELKKARESAKIVVSKRKTILWAVGLVLLLTSLLTGWWIFKDSNTGKTENPVDTISKDSIENIRENSTPENGQESPSGSNNNKAPHLGETKNIPKPTGTPGAVEKPAVEAAPEKRNDMKDMLRPSKEKLNPSSTPVEEVPPKQEEENNDNSGGENLSKVFCMPDKINTQSIPNPDKWYVQCLASVEKRSSQEGVCIIKKKGFNAFMIEINIKEFRYKVLSGPFDNQDKANSCANILGKDKKYVLKGKKVIIK